MIVIAKERDEADCMQFLPLFQVSSSETDAKEQKKKFRSELNRVCQEQLRPYELSTELFKHHARQVREMKREREVEREREREEGGEREVRGKEREGERERDV